MTARLNIAVLLTVHFLFTWTAYADDDLEARAADHLSNILYSSLHGSYTRVLTESGLSENEIGVLIDDAMDRYSKCAVEALAADPDPKSFELLTVLANGESEEAIGEVFANSSKNRKESLLSRLESVVMPCWIIVNQELGIPEY